MPKLQGDVKVPLIGNIPKRGLVIGVLAGGGVLAYVLYRRHQANQAAMTADGYGYGYGSYGYAESQPGYYGYGYGYGSAGGTGYGYGGFGGGSSPPPWWDVAPAWWQIPGKTSGTGKAGVSVITAMGNMDLNKIARMERISLAKLIRLNPQLKRYEGTGKHIPRGTRIKV